MSQSPNNAIHPIAGRSPFPEEGEDITQPIPAKRWTQGELVEALGGEMVPTDWAMNPEKYAEPALGPEMTAFQAGLMRRHGTNFRQASTLEPSYLPEQYSRPLFQFDREPESDVSGFWSSVREANLPAFLLEKATWAVADLSGAYAGTEINAEEFLKAAGVNGEMTYTEKELEYLHKARTTTQLIERQRQVATERARREAMSEMSFGASLGAGLLGGVLDPTSYVPVFGQAGRVKHVSTIYRQATAMVARGKMKAARQLLVRDVSGGFRRGFWIGASENAIVESGFQAIRYAATIDEDAIGGEVLPSIAMTSAFGGVLGGGVGYLSYRGARRQMYKRSKQFVDWRNSGTPEMLALPPGRQEGQLALPPGRDPNWVEGQSDPNWRWVITDITDQKALPPGQEPPLALPPGRGTLPGAGPRPRPEFQPPSAPAPLPAYRREPSGPAVDRFNARMAKTNAIKARKQESGIAPEEALRQAEAEVRADALKDPEVLEEIQALQDTGLYTRKEAEAMVLDGDAGRSPELEEEIAQGKADAEESLVKFLLDSRFAGDEAEAKVMAKPLLESDPNWVAPVDMDGNIRADDYAIKLVASKFKSLRPKNLAAAKGQLTKAINKTDDPTLKAELIRRRKQLDDYGRLLTEAEEAEAAIRDQAARNLNNPRTGAEVATPSKLAEEGVGASAASKVLAEAGPKSAREFFQMLADSMNGTFGMLDFIRYGFGRGLVGTIKVGRQFTIRVPEVWDYGAFGQAIKVLVKKAEMKKGVYGHATVLPSGRRVVAVDFDQIVRDWDTIKNEKYRFVKDGVGSEKLYNSKTAKPFLVEYRVGDRFETPEQYADFVLMHEIAHQQVIAKHHGLVKAWQDANPGKDFEKSDLYKRMEAETDSIVFAWAKRADDIEAEHGPMVSEGFADGMAPQGGSIVLNKKQWNTADGPSNAMKVWFELQGLSKAAVLKAHQWLKITSPVARISMSPSKIARTMARHLTEAPFSLTGAPIRGGSAGLRLSSLYISKVYDMRKQMKSAWREVNEGLDKSEMISFDDFDARVHRAIAKKSGDRVSDDYTKAVVEAANQFIEFNRWVEAESKGIAWMDDLRLPADERYYRRVYNMDEVMKDDFLVMLEGQGMTREEAKEIQDLITSNYGSVTSEFGEIGVRGAARTRGKALADIDYDVLAPFLDTSAFRTELNMAKTLGGETELRKGVLAAARELGLDTSKILRRQDDIDPETGEITESLLIFDMEPIEEAIVKEFKSMKRRGGLIVNPENLSAMYKTDWGKGSELAAKYPEHARQLKQFADDHSRGIGLMKMNSIISEEVFARKFLNQVVGTLQHTRDIPQNPDSWLQARLPALIKNASHSVLGGFVGIANVADFHRSIAMHGIKRSFSNEWGLLIKDIDGFMERSKVTERLGLALEEQSAEVDRSLRNMNEHVTPKSKVEDLAESGARWMSRLNGMDRITNLHQKMFASSAMDFIFDAVPQLLDGKLDAKSVRKLEMMNIGKKEAAELQDWFQNGGMKTSDLGTRFVDMDAKHSARLVFKTAIHKAVFATQTVPGRDELFDIQTQGWGGVVMMYRNWVTAANNRVVGSALTNPEAALMSGLMASVGLGALIVSIRWALSGEHDQKPWDNSDQFLRDSLLAGGYLGMAGEAGSLISRLTDDNIDPLVVGEGSSRHYNADTAISSILGASYHFPQTIKNTFDDTEIDRHDVNRIKGLAPWNTLFYFDGAYNQIEKASDGN